MTAIVVIVLFTAIGVYSTIKAAKSATWIDDEKHEL